MISKIVYKQSEGATQMKTPLYHKIYLDFIEKIDSNDLKPGDALPTEAEMEKIYGTSRAPVRQALAKLEYEAYIERKQGKGTFVANREKAEHWFRFGGFGLHFSRDFDQIFCKTIEVKTVQADHMISKILFLPLNSKVTRITRIRYIHDDPVFFLEHFLNQTIGEKVLTGSDDFFAISQALEETTGIRVKSVQEDLQAKPALPETARHLQIQEGSPVLRIFRTSYDDYDIPVIFTRYSVRSDLWFYRSTFHIGDIH